MITKTYELALKLAGSDYSETDISLVQNDNKVNALQIKIFDEDAELNYSQINSAIIVFAKQDDTVVQGNLTKDNSGFTYTFGTNEIACPGIVIACVQLMGSTGERLTTSRFKFTVIGDLITSEAVQSTTEFAILQRLEQELEAIDVVALTNKVGTGSLNTTAQNCVNAVNEVNTKVNTHLSDLVTDTDGAHGLKIESGAFTPVLAFGGAYTGIASQSRGVYTKKLGKVYFLNVVLF